MVTDLGYQPNQDFSNDVADFHVTQDEFYAETKELITRAEPEGMWFEVVFDLLNS